VAVVPGLFEGKESDRSSWMNEVAGLDDILQFCRRIGCPRIVTSAFSGEFEAGSLEAAVEALRTAGRSAASYGITIAVLNESGMARPTASDVLELVEAVDHPAVRLAWSPSDGYRNGERPLAVVERIAPLLAYVRVADVRLDEDGFHPTPIGQGDVGWAQLLNDLHDNGYDGPVSLEVHIEPKAKYGLFDATQIIQLLRQVGRSKAEAV
jgi:sugar phosphate isomerase/epimerase